MGEYHSRYIMFPFNTGHENIGITMEFMCIQMEDRAPLQEGDTSKITTFKHLFFLNN